MFMQFRKDHSSRAARKQRRQILSRVITLEHLQPRELFAVDVSVNSNLLELDIKGSGSADNVEVSWLKNGPSEYDDQIQVKDNGQVVAKEKVWDTSGLFPSLRIQSIKFEGGDGNDTFKVTNNVLPHVKSTAPNSTWDAVISVIAKGGSGNDYLSGANGADGMSGGIGDDTLVGRDSRDILHGDDGADQLFGDAGDDQLKGGNGNDIVHGGAGNDRAMGELGNDLVDGGLGNDDVIGDFDLFDQPQLAGQGGNDTLFGRDGNDNLVGGNGDDVIHGGWGTDKIWGDSYFDQFIAQDAKQMGNDLIYGDPLKLEAGAVVGNDVIFGGYLNDVIYGSFGVDEIHGNHGDDSIFGGDGDDRLFGEEGNDALLGQNGNDVLEGGKGVDSLDGGAGDDTLDGGLDCAADKLVGGLGKDRFRVENYISGNKLKNRDNPSDFSSLQGDMYY